MEYELGLLETTIEVVSLTEELFEQPNMDVFEDELLIMQ